MKNNTLVSLMILVVFVFISSCGSRKKSFANDLIGWWNISEYWYFDSIEFTNPVLLLQAEDSCSIPLVRGMPLESNDVRWQVIQTDPPRIQILCEDTIFSGIWEVRNITRSAVPQHAHLIMSFELYQPTKSFFFFRR